MPASSIERETFDFIDDLSAATASGEVYDLFGRKIAAFGLTTFAMADMPAPHSKLDGHIILNAWPQGWFARYVSQNFYAADPVARRLRESAHPFFWHEAGASAKGSAARRVMDEAAEFGLKHGFSVPLHGARGQLSCITMAGERLSIPPRGRISIHMMASYAHAKASELRVTSKRRSPPDRPALTEREREVLRWVAMGKSDWEIGEILGISAETAFAHVRNSTRKLGAMTRTHAVALAILAGKLGM
jgi:LuxR family transcriptional regulator, quorum-sensing system regulator BjaR1